MDQPVGFRSKAFRPSANEDSDTGRRSDSAHAYIHSTRAHAKGGNLHLVCNTKVEKVIIEGDRATGVKVVPTKPLHPSENQSREYKARKFIIVSGGTLSSPLILQRSGIGKILTNVAFDLKLTVHR